MTGGEKVLIVGAVGLGVVAFLKARATPGSPVAPPPGAPTVVNPTIEGDSVIGAIPVVGQIYRFVKPTAPVVQGAFSRLNNSIGGTNPYAGLTPNGDGTYTDGSGCKITPQPDGSVKRDCGSWDKNIKDPSKTTVVATGGLVYVAKLFDW